MSKRLFIHQKIIRYQIISLLIITFIIGIIFYRISYNREIKDLDVQAEQIKERLITNLAACAAESNPGNCDNFLLQEISNKYILAIIIIKDGSTFIGKIKSSKNEITNVDDIVKFQDELKNKYKIIKTNIIYKDIVEEKNPGELQLYITDRSVKSKLTGVLLQIIFQSLFFIIFTSLTTYLILNKLFKLPLQNIAENISNSTTMTTAIQAASAELPEIAALTSTYENIANKLRSKIESLKINMGSLIGILDKSKEITLELNTASLEIEAATQEQTSAISEHASGITEVSATLEELSITAKQITKNVGELVLSSEDVLKLLDESEKQLMQTVTQLEDVGKVSASNSSEIAQLGKKSEVINQMVKMIKEIANKTNMLSINASIEASKSKESGAGFSVIASEIRELSAATISSVKNVEKAAKEIAGFFKFIIRNTDIESKKVIKSAEVAKAIYDNMETIVGKIKNNYSFTQKIDVSIKQQETGSRQAAETMKQMAEISRQSAETARQTSTAIKNIVDSTGELDALVKSFNPDTYDTSATDTSDYNTYIPPVQISKPDYLANNNIQFYSIIIKISKSLTHVIYVMIFKLIPEYFSTVWNSTLKVCNLARIKTSEKFKNIKQKK